MRLPSRHRASIAPHHHGPGHVGCLSVPSHGIFAVGKTTSGLPRACGAVYAVHAVRSQPRDWPDAARRADVFQMAIEIEIEKDRARFAAGGKVRRRDAEHSYVSCPAASAAILARVAKHQEVQCNATQGKAEQSTARSTTWSTRNKRNVLSDPRRACATPAPTVRYTRFDPFDLVARHESNMPGTCSYLESQAPDTRAGRTGTVCI